MVEKWDFNWGEEVCQDEDYEMAGPKRNPS